MNIDFPLILTSLTIISGLIYLIDVLFLANRHHKIAKCLLLVVDYGRSFFPVFLIVLVIRSFIVQPFRIPTGSLEPTIRPGDFVIVSQSSYGLRLPVLNKKVLRIGEPKVGDIVVFRYPCDTSINYIKRVIGVPGDHIIYKNKQLTVNGKLIHKKFVKDGIDFGSSAKDKVAVKIYEENLFGVRHLIKLRNYGGETEDYDIMVPSGNYFVMGDNRDNSADSRFWGFVPESNLIGKAVIIWMSWNGIKHRIRWSRIGKRL